MSMGAVAYEAVKITGKDILFFSLWWYTKGVGVLFRGAMASAQRQAVVFAVGVWVKNLFVPMYGQYDWQGRIISFFVRLMQIIARSIAFGVWILVLLVGCGVYIVLPPLLLLLIFRHAHLAL